MPRWAALLTVGLLIAAGFLLYRSTAVPERPGRPNILLIVTDDQRAEGTLRVMPNVRRWFTRAGTTFENAYATTPLCCPSRATILSGRYAHNHGVKLNHLSHEVDGSTMIQEHLQGAGYRTAISGKFLNQWGAEHPPPGFDRWSIFLEGEYYDRRWNLDGDVRLLPDYTNDVVRDKALGYLRGFDDEGDGDPWFLYVGTNAAHAPFTPEPRYRSELPGRSSTNPAMREKDVSDKPELRHTSGRRPYVRRGQLRTLMSADDAIGRIFEELSALGEVEDTLAIFMSDNGMQWGEHGYTGKRLPFEPSTRVPLIVRWPGRVERAGSDDLVANVDVAPTLLEAAGIKDAPRTDGRSLLQGRKRTELLLEHWGDADTAVPDWASLVSARAQYIEYYAGDDSVRWRGFYDLRRDPWQLHNLLGDERPGNDPDLDRLSRRLSRYRACSGASCP